MSRSRTRKKQIFAAMMVLMIILILRLFILTVVEGTEWQQAADSVRIKRVYTSAPRGDIYDRYGRLLAGNHSSFTVFFTGSNYTSKEINDQAQVLINLLKDNEETLNDNLPLLYDAEGKLYFSYDREIENWLLSMDMPLNYTAEEAFNDLRLQYEVEDDMDRYEAQEQLQSVYSVYPPISVRNMKFLEELEKESFLGRYYLDYDLSAEETFTALRKYFGIEEDISEHEARNIMIVRNELAAQGYLGYLPATIATGISQETIVTLSERSTEFPSVDVVAESVRYYPKEKVAAHTIGYLGKISESEKESYVEKGYAASDLVGKDGAEKAFESILRGKDGVKHVEVNAYGDPVRVLNEVEAEKGQDVYLTIDMDLQETTEEALRQALAKIRVGGTFESVYGNYKYSKAYKNAYVGAAVAIDVETGEVLSMASEPAYDPNLFAQGISTEDWNSLQSENPRDPLSPLPLFNVAARTAVQPGSTFKMVTATAALDSGLDPNKRLRDGGAVKVGNRTYGCILWNMSRGTHGYLNLYEALEVSCNYYFYDISTGKDYYTGKSLNYDIEMNIDRLTSYAEQYGLGLPTGIEIAETVVPVPSETRKMSAWKTYLRNVLTGRAEMYFKEEVIKNKEQLMKQIDTIVSWMEENPSRNTILERLSKLGIKEDMIETVGDLCKFSYFNQASWTLGDEFNIAIGQGENAYTPLQMANYVATIGNKGVRNQVSILRAVEDEGLVEKEPGTPLDVSDESIFDDIIEGMRRVAHGSRGSARTFFARFPVAVAAKTGTAERAGKIQPPSEVEYLKKYLPRINSAIKWEQVEEEMYRLMEEYPDVYTTENVASKQAVLNLSRGKVTIASIDRFKDDYDNFSWFVALAPAEDPKIAVAVLLFQGGSGGYAGPVAREIIGKYLELDKTYDSYNLDTVITD